MYSLSTQRIALRQGPDRCGVGVDCPKMPQRRRFGATTAGRFARGRAGDILHSVHRLPVVCRATFRSTPRSSAIYARRDTGRWQGIVQAWFGKRGGNLGTSTPTAAVIDSQTASATCRATRLRPGQAPPRTQAAHRRRFRWPSAGGPGPRLSRQRSGCPWCSTASRTPARALSQTSARLCPSGLSRQITTRCALPLRQMDHRDCPAATRRQRLPLLPRAGWWSAHLHGSAGAAVSPRTSRAPPPPKSLGFSSLISDS